MARLFTTGFEENDFLATAWTRNNLTGWTLSTAIVRSGSYSAVTAATGGSLERVLPANLTSGSVYGRHYFYVKDGLTSGEIVKFTQANQAGQSLSISISNITNHLTITNIITAAAATGTYTLLVNTWYRLEYGITIADSGGHMEYRLFLGDSTVPLETVAPADGNTLSSGVGDFFLVARFGGANVVYIDDAALNDSSGSFQNSWCGPGSVVLLKTVSDSSVQLTKNTGASNSDAVDDLPGTPDDATTYNYEATTLNHIDRLNVAALPGGMPDCSIKLVDVYARIGSTASSNSREMRLKLWDESGNLTDGPSASAQVNGYRILATNEHLVYDATGKTKSNVENFDLGYENITSVASRQRNITALWANVEYIASQTVSAVGAIASAAAMGVASILLSIALAGAIATAQAFGTATVSLSGGASPQTLSNVGAIASAEAIGTHKLNQNLIGAGGIASAVAFGSATLKQRITGAGGIASGEAFGHAAFIYGQLISGVGGIPTRESWGMAQLWPALAISPRRAFKTVGREKSSSKQGGSRSFKAGLREKSTSKQKETRIFKTGPRPRGGA